MNGTAQRRLHDALMPDYGPGATTLWFAVTAGGALALAACAAQLAALGWVAWLQVAAASALAIRTPTPRARSSSSFCC